MEENASRLKEAYADFPNASDFIDHMQTGDLSIAAQLIDNGSVDILVLLTMFSTTLLLMQTET